MNATPIASTASPAGAHTVELSIGGMTCASCAARVEKKLNKMSGVTATVNYATEKAKISYPDTVSETDLVATVEATGYTAALPALAATPTLAPEASATADATGQLRQRLLISLALSWPVVVLAMVPVAQFRNWQWASLVLASPVVIWGAWPFHRAAWTNARHRAATMDTLISRPWTPSFHSESPRRICGHCGRCSSDTPAPPE